jgi:hypothetical protein
MVKWTITRTCEQCGIEFLPRGNVKGRFCTHRCYGQSRITDKIERFWVRVNKTDTCWLWTGQTDSNGYGDYAALKPFRYKAHRFSYLLAHGSIPKGAVIRHACDNPPCVRPDHLIAGTQGDNTRDRDERNRTARGERQGSAKLTDEGVRQAKALRAGSGLTYEVLGHMFGVDRQVISKAIRGLTWSHVK